MTSLTAATAVVATSSRSFGLPSRELRLGLNTFSLRALPHDTAIPTIIRVMKEQKLQDCELWFIHVEPQFGPVFAWPSKSGVVPAPPTPQQLEERKAAAAARSDWRLSVPISYFENIRSQFEKEGLQIKAYAVPFSNSETELDRLFLMAKALGAESIIGRVPEPLTNLVAAAANKHQLRVGIQVTDVKLLDQQLDTSSFLRADPDAGDLTKAGLDPLQFVQQHADRIDCIDLKDAIAGTGSVPFGEGNAKLSQILRFLERKHLPITAYIDCDYPGTGESLEEIGRCASFARRALSSS